MSPVAIAALFVSAIGLAQQTPPVRELHGTVLNGQSGSQVARATVELGCWIPGVFRKTAQVLTDSSGAFKFTNVPGSAEDPAICGADVSRNGYLPFHTDRIDRGPIVFELTPQDVIAGTVKDENGKPLPYAHVIVLSHLRGSGSYALQSASDATTDDRGQFRIVRLAAGSYRVCVDPPRVLHLPLGGMAYERLCYPESSSGLIVLRPGETRNVQFDFKPIPAVRVSGHLLNATPAPYFQLSRETADGLVPLIDEHDWTPATFTFEFPAVIPGKYLLTVESSSMPRLRATQKIVVGSSGLANLELTLEPPRQLEGVIKSDDDSTLPARMAVTFKPVPAGAGEYADVDDRGTFRLSLSDSQPYEVRIDQSPWYLQSIKQAGQDITGRMLEPLPDGSWGRIEIVASRSRGSIQGTMRASTDRSYVVYLLQERNRGFQIAWYLQCNGQHPKFEINGIPPGEYRIIAVKAEVDIPYLERSYLASRAGFVTVLQVIGGQTSKVEVTPLPDDSEPARQ